MKQLGLLVLALSFVFITACEKNNKKPGYQIDMLTDMVKPVPYEAYSKNPVFKDGRTMQHPVKETVARGSLFHSVDGQNPIPYSDSVMNRGEHMYKSYCFICHGSLGDGDGPLIPKFPNPPVLGSRRVKALTPKMIFDVISNGKGEMPGHAGQIAVEDRWKIVYFVEKLQGKRK